VHALLAAGAALSCGVVVIVTEPVTIPLLRRLAASDTSDFRSPRFAPPPRGGGAPLVAGLVIALLLSGLADGLTFAAAVLAFTGIGLASDFAGLAGRRRLILQAAAGLAVGWSLAGLLALPAVAEIGAAIPLALWLTGYVRAFTAADEVSGLCTAGALAGGCAFALIGVLRGDALLAVAGGAVAAGSCALLPFTAGQAQVLLGDVGCCGLGAALALLAACAVLRGVPAEAALGPVALVVADGAWMLRGRLASGPARLAAEHAATGHRLRAAGWSRQQVTAGTAGLTAALSLLGLASLTSYPALRAVADLAGLAVLAGYLRSPVLLRQGTHSGAHSGAQHGRRAAATTAAVVLHREAA
jgi:UDP-N-acetylmuramyl pentapeptide phosphotransferase/UDP-N-acetylglucosamine-1-phosphate transferase